MRARDEDRATACATLDAALADGQISAAEHEQRVNAAMTASTIGALNRLTVDLQGQRVYPSETKPAGPPLVAPLIIALAAIVVVFLVFARAFGEGGDEPDRPALGDAGYLSPRGMAEVIEAVQAEYGTSMVDELDIRPQYATVERQDPAAPRRQLNSRYDGSFVETSDGTREAQAGRIDLTTIDVPKLAGLIAGSRESLNLSRIDTIYVLISADEEDGPEIQVHANNELKENGYFSVLPDGTPLSVHPFDPDA